MNLFARFAKRWFPATSMLTLVLTAGVAHSQLTMSECGGEGDPACTTTDPAYYANNDWTILPSEGMECDYGLTHVSRYGPNCGNGNRHTLPDTGTSVLGRQMLSQEYSLGADTPINWLSIFGSHNSFSSYRAGAINSIVADQLYSISDQLQAGARTIMLDPHFYDGQMRLCHNSIGADNTVCRATQGGRLYLFAIKEIAYWLDAHPGEFLVLRLNFPADKQYDYLLDDPIRTYLGSRVYSPLDWDHKLWPTLRQLRGQGKQIAILGSNPTNLIFSWDQYVLNDAQPNGTNLDKCENNDGRDVRIRAYNQFAYISEDRSGSGDLGDLDSYLFPLLHACGFSFIDVDFLDAVNDAYLDPIKGPDDRPQASVWSMATGVNPDTEVPMVMSDFKMVLGQKSDIHPFACAGPGTNWLETGKFPAVYFPASHDWEITKSSGVWHGGEAACQTEFGPTYHFWAPATGMENAELAAKALAVFDPRPFWVNYFGGPVLTGTPNSPIIQWKKIQSLPPAQRIVLRGGTGGALQLVAGEADGSQAFFSFGTVAMAAPNLAAVSLDPALVKSLPPGTYTQTLQVNETDPATGRINTTSFPVTLQVTDQLVLDTSAVTIANCDSRPLAHVSVKSGGTFTTESSAPWAQVGADRYTAPATLTITADTTGLSVGQHLAWVKVISTGNSGRTSFQVTLNVQPQTIINSSPDTSVPLLVDGRPFYGVNGFCWAAGSRHTVSATLSDPFSAGTRWEFSSWTDGGAATHTITQANAAGSLTAHYALQYKVTTGVNNSQLGSIQVSPSSTDGYYPANAQLTFSATPRPTHHFSDFLVNGTKTAVNPLPLSLTGPTQVIADFSN